ncbi:phospholipid carrier-dependent glycosyltransferase [Paenibacillus durus]|nr:glycosyltransferase family 39 protein [Paenibacillus durus]
MMKKWRIAAKLMFMLLLCMLVIPPGTMFAEGNLLQNPGFEETASGAPASWVRDVWVQGDQASLLSVESADVHSGIAAAAIENMQQNHAKWIQTIAVKPDTHYRISGWVKVVNAGAEGIGANIFVVGVGGGYPSTKDTGGGWQQLQFIGKTGSGQKEIGIGAALGGYGNLSAGKAYFDDLSVEELNSAPAGVPVISLDPGGAQTGEAGKPVKISSKNILFFSALFACLFAWVYRTALRSKRQLRRESYDYGMWLWIVLSAAFLLRLWLGWTSQGYMNDMKTFMYWGQRLAEVGPGRFYQEGIFADYPPGYIYILYLLHLIQQGLGLSPDSPGEMLLFKLPAILSDIVLGWLIYRIGSKKLGGGIALGLVILYSFNPAVLTDSAVWGQADAFFVVFLLLSILAVSDRRLAVSALWFAVATAVKPQALIFTPALLFAFIHYRAWKELLKGAVYGLIAFTLITLPFFWGNGGLGGLIDLYKSTLSSYPYSTVNAFNLYTLIAPSWSPIDQLWLGIPYRAWGNIFIIVAVALAALFSFRKDRKDLSKSFFIGLVLIVVMFVVGTKMHERYMFPALVLSLFAFMEIKDRRLLTLFFGLSLTQFANVEYVLLYLNAGQNPGSDGIVLVTSIANVGLLLYMLYIGWDIFFRRRVLTLAPAYTDKQKRETDLALVCELRPDHSPQGSAVPRMMRRDWLWMAAITVLYGALAMVNLGSARSPETVWAPSAAGESFYVDLGTAKQLDKVRIFGGVGTGEFTLDFGDSPQSWSGPVKIKEDVGNVFIWKSQQLNATARYVRVFVNNLGFYLHEIAFYEKGNASPLPVAEVSSDIGGTPKQGAPANLFDEQQLIPANSGYMNSTYFDEIYHARTAYEYAHGIVPYENTHPPLGKLLISVGMALFGVNPFGWRIVGTVFGIAMLPVMYVMALRLFGRTRYAALAAGLFALDFMHFTQTRISTIDVYGVFFIMLMFYFMQRYAAMNFYRLPLRKTLWPLFWSGLFFGIGVASKWIVLYGGAGLAVMLGISLFDRYRQHRAARRVLAEGKRADPELSAACQEAAGTFWSRTVITLASCIIFFIVIPAAIYSLSFIPVLSVTPEGYTIKGLLEAQKNMYDYHSQLVATHPFSSQWWQWPFMKRPVWFFSGGEGLPAGQTSSIVTMGNPLIWWTGVFAILAVLWLTLRRREKPQYVIWIGYFSQYIPWMLVPRETFLYHYFAMVPFMILALVYLLKLSDSVLPESRSRVIRYVYVATAALLFIMFYPVLSGMQVSGDYVTGFLRWFPTWVF